MKKPPKPKSPADISRRNRDAHTWMHPDPMAWERSRPSNAKCTVCGLTWWRLYEGVPRKLVSSWSGEATSFVSEALCPPCVKPSVEADGAARPASRV